MKGTPFYTGEYSVRKGTPENRVNLWPVMYYRDPALSVLWPIFEKTDDHLAVRPVFSVYGRDKSSDVGRKYNVLWPIGQFDTRSGDNRIFPVMWGRDYFNVFPVYWNNGKTLVVFPVLFVGKNFHSVFPIYMKSDRRFLAAAGLFHIQFDNGGTHGWHLLPFYGAYENSKARTAHRFWLWPLGSTWRKGEDRGGRFLPLYVWWGDNQERTILTPLWMQGSGRDSRLDWYVVPPLFLRQPESKSLWTPLFGWRRNGIDRMTYVTPLVSWWDEGKANSGFSLFPLLYHKRDDAGTFMRYLLLGSHERSMRCRSDAFLPLFSHEHQGSLSGAMNSTNNYANARESFWCLPFCWRENSYCHYGTNTASRWQTFTADRGVFPLWSRKATRTVTAASTNTVDNTSVLLCLFDRRHEVKTGSKQFEDYIRSRVLWRLWHYEKLNGDVSVDVFPAITYDRKADGHAKTSVFWRLYRHEKTPGEKSKLDILFIPIRR